MAVQCIVGRILSIRPIDFCDEYLLCEYFKETLEIFSFNVFLKQKKPFYSLAKLEN
jgi:hypothetical protein